MATKITRVNREVSGSSVLVRRPRNFAMNSIMARLLLHWGIQEDTGVAWPPVIGSPRRGDPFCAY